MTTLDNASEKSISFHDIMAFHRSLHPGLGNLLQHSVLEAAYIGGSTSRSDSSKPADLDLFIIIRPDVTLDQLTKIVKRLFFLPNYLVGDPSYLEGFGDFHKILHRIYPIDLFSNKFKNFTYNKMMENNQIIFDKEGRLQKLLTKKDDSAYVQRRIHQSRVDIIYFNKMLTSKLRKGDILASVRAYLRLLHALGELSMHAEDPEMATYSNLNGDYLVKHLMRNFAIDYKDLSRKSMHSAINKSAEFLRESDLIASKFLNV